MTVAPVLIPFTRNFIANYANSGRTDGGYLQTHATFALEEVLWLFPELLTASGRACLREELERRNGGTVERRNETRSDAWTMPDPPDPFDVQADWDERA